MRLISSALLALLLAADMVNAQSDTAFSGTWKLNPARSDLQNSPVPADPILNVTQSGATLIVSGIVSGIASGGSQTRVYPLDKRAEKRVTGDISTNTVTKWRGAALLVNTLVSGPENYTLMERWTRSRSGSTLTIRRTVVRLSGETESLLVYENPDAAPVAPAPVVAKAAPPTLTPVPSREIHGDYAVEKGSRVLLRLTNSVNTKHAAAGDRVYLETAAPVFVNRTLIIPRGSYVAGTLTESHQAGRVKGKSSLTIRFDSLTLPNGVTRDFRSRPGSVDTRGNLDRSEGKITGEGNKGGDARTIGERRRRGPALEQSREVPRVTWEWARGSARRRAPQPV